ncbi:MAG: hypothetical protein IT378_09960 [Sandaracinaceae bacterium]|nr:hypothetical protein [Sandaracinaceae bacterium]
MNGLLSRHRLVAFALVAACLVPAAASAQDAAARRFMVGGGLGGSFGLNRGLDSQFKLEQFVGYSIVPVRDHPGLFIAGVFSQGFIDYVRLTWAVRLGFAIQVFHHSDFEILVTPLMQLGGTGFFPPNGNAGGAFNWMFGVQGEFVLFDGLLGLFFRPLAFDLNFGERFGFGGFDVLAYYELMTGVVIRL